MYLKFIKLFFIIIILLILLSAICLNQNSNLITNQLLNESINSKFFYSLNSTFSWPIFGYYSISSFFGNRISPTNNASSYHSGIDIPAPERN
jgi:murein DD-endopeptidase MepM/ murein hydrolase activator NlpD